MKKLLLFPMILLALSGCMKSETAEERPTDKTSKIIPNFYGYALLETDAVQTRGVADASKVWHPEVAKDGITIKFLNGSASYQEFVREVAHEWEKYGGIVFRFLDAKSTEDAIVRIGFDYVPGMNASWSLTGTDHLAVYDNQTEVTMNFAQWRYKGDAAKRSDVLRAFGQVIGLELEFRHPMFCPAWFTDENGNVDEEYIREYWEEELQGFISWEELKKVVLEPLSNQAITISKTEYYDQESVMNWPFYRMIANNIPPVEFDNDYKTELSDNDKAFVKKLYGESWIDRVHPDDLYQLITFEFTGTKLELVLTGNKDLAIVWDGSNDNLNDNTAFYHPDNETGEYKHTITKTYEYSKTRKIIVCEILEHGHDGMPNNSAVLTKFDLRSGVGASNFDFKPLRNLNLSYIRIVGGTGFKAQTFDFNGFPYLKHLYLNQIGDSKIIVDNCPNLTTLATSTHIYYPSSLTPMEAELGLLSEDIIQNAAPRIIGPDEQVTQWPTLPESQYSLSSNSASSLTILGCKNLKTLSLENTRLLNLNLNALNNLEYLYLSSTDNYIISGGGSPTTIGKNLYDTLLSLQSRTGKSQGTIVLRCIDAAEGVYTYIPINIAIYNAINRWSTACNWNLRWVSGVTPLPSN